MGIKIVTYGGKIGWFLRKHFSKYTSEAYLEFQYRLRRQLFRKYAVWFDSQREIPLPCLISIETINRCNSNCAFCPVNKTADPRPFQKMDEQLFKKIIQELADVNYNGYLNLYVNNEPLADKRIEEWYRFAKEQLPNAKTLMYTNGTLLNLERFKKLAPYVDKMIINNYSDKLVLHENINTLYEFVKNDDRYRNSDITIQIRYIKEILSNRAGDAPNKKRRKNNHWECIMPYTDLTIFPNGVVGLCCSDALEKTNYGNISVSNIFDIWSSEQYRELRKMIGNDRSKYSFCLGCDFMDAGIRNEFIRNKLMTYLKE